MPMPTNAEVIRDIKKERLKSKIDIMSNDGINVKNKNFLFNDWITNNQNEPVRPKYFNFVADGDEMFREEEIVRAGNYSLRITNIGDTLAGNDEFETNKFPIKNNTNYVISYIAYIDSAGNSLGTDVLRGRMMANIYDADQQDGDEGLIAQQQPSTLRSRYINKYDEWVRNFWDDSVGTEHSDFQNALSNYESNYGTVENFEAKLNITISWEGSGDNAPEDVSFLFDRVIMAKPATIDFVTQSKNSREIVKTFHYHFTSHSEAKDG